MRYEHYERKKRELFLDRLANIFQTKRKIVEQFLNFESQASFRINPLKDLLPEIILKELKKRPFKFSPIPWCPDAYFLESPKEQLSHDPLFTKGYVYLQNASSLIPPLALDPKPNETILDMCAAPGGKSAHLQALAENKAHLWLNDLSLPRIKKMKQILKTYHVHSQRILHFPAEILAEMIEEQFDKILLDAQCSGEGMINLAHPRAMRYWSLFRVNKFQKVQKKMLKSAFNLLKPNGVLIYSTCTFAPEENELVISQFLAENEKLNQQVPAGFSQAKILPINLDLPNRMPGLTAWEGQPLNPDLRHALRVIPNQFMEGFFVCKLRKV